MWKIVDDGINKFHGISDFTNDYGDGEMQVSRWRKQRRGKTKTDRQSRSRIKPSKRSTVVLIYFRWCYEIFFCLYIGKMLCCLFIFIKFLFHKKPLTYIHHNDLLKVNPFRISAKMSLLFLNWILVILHW